MMQKPPPPYIIKANYTSLRKENDEFLIEAFCPYQRIVQIQTKDLRVNHIHKLTEFGEPTIPPLMYKLSQYQITKDFAQKVVDQIGGTTDDVPYFQHIAQTVLSIIKKELLT